MVGRWVAILLFWNPFDKLADKAGQAIKDGWIAIMTSLWNGALYGLRVALTYEQQFLTPDISADGPLHGVYQLTLWMAGALVVMLVMV